MAVVSRLQESGLATPSSAVTPAGAVATVAGQLGIADAEGGLLPDGKLAAIAALRAAGRPPSWWATASTTLRR